MNTVTVVGLGAVGKNLAVALAQKNFKVVVVTRRGAKGFDDLKKFIDKLCSEDKLTMSKTEAVKRISWTKNFSEKTLKSTIVIEAVKENLIEKQKLFQKMDSIFSPEVVLASVTSSLSISDISCSSKYPNRIIGLHPFNPVLIMKLIEVIPNSKTSQKTIDSVVAFSNQIGKVPIIVPDQPGFLVNRLLFVMINEAINVLAEGKLSAGDIDQAMKLGANHPIGPLHLADLIGLDICLDILKNLHAKECSKRYEPNPLLIQKVKDNCLGRKTGQGFFKYISLK
jgi:3-hydroxybutyryl-CoA dehydrogenase